MTGHALALIEDLHRPARAAGIHLLADQLIRRAVVMTVQFDVIVQIHARLLPLRIHERLQRQRLQRRSIDSLIQLGTRTGQLAKGPLIQLVNQLQDGLVQLRQTEELALAQRRQHPPLHDLNSDLRLGFVPWAIRPRRKDAHAIMNRQIAIGAIQLRLVVAGLLHARLQVVRERPAGSFHRRTRRPGHARESSPTGSASRWLRRRCSCWRPAPRRTLVPGEPRRSSDPSPAPSDRHNPQTSFPRRGVPAASPRQDGAASRGKARSTSCRRSPSGLACLYSSHRS